MACRWTHWEETIKREELRALYVVENKTMKEVGDILGIKESSVYTRLKRLNVPVTPNRKYNYLNRRHDIVMPATYDTKLAEFIGIMLGDGHISSTQVQVTIYQKEQPYLHYVSDLMKEIFGVRPTQGKWTAKHVCTLYLGSTEIVRYLQSMGLVRNKTKEQVAIPSWISGKRDFSKSFLRGFFDTDGSIYKLRFGVQMNFCNRSRPLLCGIREILGQLEYHPSHISGYNLYLTRKPDLFRYAQEIGFGNQKHLAKAQKFGILEQK